MFSIGLALVMGSFIETQQQMGIWTLPVVVFLIVPAFFSSEPNLAPGLKTVFSWIPTSAVSELFKFSMSSSAPINQVLTNLALVGLSSAFLFTVVVWKVRRADR